MAPTPHNDCSSLLVLRLALGSSQVLGTNLVEVPVVIRSGDEGVERVDQESLDLGLVEPLLDGGAVVGRRQDERHHDAPILLEKVELSGRLSFMLRTQPQSGYFMYRITSARQASYFEML